MLPLSTYAGSAAAGVFSHVAYFHRGEHHLYGTLYIKLFITLLAAGTVALSSTQEIAWTTALNLVCQLAGSYLLGLYGSLLTYRLFLHPLGKFPGPFAARVSTLWISTQLNHNVHLKLHEFHEKYGQFVRTGSSDLSISHPRAIEAIYSSNSRCTKGTWYDSSLPIVSLQTYRDPAEHHARRRVWSGAFSDKLLRGYEQRVRVYRQKLVESLTGLSDKPVDAMKWFNLYAFDVMGDLSFGRSFEGIERGEEHWAIKLLRAGMEPFGLFIPAWVFLILAAIPGVAADFFKFLDFCGKRLVERLNNKPDIPDVSSALIAHLEGKEITKEDQNLLDGDARLVIVAGSDTTAITLTAAFYELVRHPQEIEKLRAELAPYVDASEPSGEFLHSKIAHLDHLNGVINEALRLYPPVPSALHRKTPPEGIVIDGVHIPGETNVICPQWVMARSESCYAQPYEFIPERWYKNPELVKDKGAFAPFSIGSYNCIGKPLALMNIRTTLARLVMDFDVKFAPGEDGSRFLNEARDNFVIYLGPLDLVFTRRQ